MDGSNRTVIVEDRITWPNGLTLDFINDRIYWADAREDYIEFASLDGSNRHTGNVYCHRHTHSHVIGEITILHLPSWNIKPLSHNRLFNYVKHTHMA